MKCLVVARVTFVCASKGHGVYKSSTCRFGQHSISPAAASTHFSLFSLKTCDSASLRAFLRLLKFLRTRAQDECQACCVCVYKQRLWGSTQSHTSHWLCYSAQDYLWILEVFKKVGQRMPLFWTTMPISWLDHRVEISRHYVQHWVARFLSHIRGRRWMGGWILDFAFLVLFVYVLFSFIFAFCSLFLFVFFNVWSCFCLYPLGVHYISC